MAPKLGQIVTYMISNHDADTMNRRRADAARNMAEHRSTADGSVVHVGNRESAGDVAPMVIVRVWNEDPGTVNGQVLLDGNDTLWVTSVVPGDGVGQYVAAE